MKSIMGVDPGKEGAFVILSGEEMAFAVMPLKEKEVDFTEVLELLRSFKPDHVYLERAMPMAMGSKHAFNYGRDFAKLELAIKLLHLPVTYIEPAKWMKLMLQGIDLNLKPKARSRIAVERLFPAVVEQIPRNKNGKLHEGVIDALLIAEFGRRCAP